MVKISKKDCKVSESLSDSKENEFKKHYRITVIVNHKRLIGGQKLSKCEKLRKKNLDTKQSYAYGIICS